MVELPDEAGLRGVAHPGDDGGGGMEQLRVAALVHGAVGLVVHQLRLADEVGEVAELAVARGDFTGVVVAPELPLAKSCSAQSSLIVSQSFCGIMPWMDSRVGTEMVPVSVLK